MESAQNNNHYLTRQQQGSYCPSDIVMRFFATLRMTYNEFTSHRSSLVVIKQL